MLLVKFWESHRYSFNTEQQLLYTHAKAQLQAHLTSLHRQYFWLINFCTVTVGLYTTIFFLTAFSSSIQMSGAACHVLQAPLPIARVHYQFHDDPPI